METPEAMKFRLEARDAVVAWMADNGWNQRRMADALNYSPSQVSKALGSGRDAGSPAFLRRVAQAVPELGWLWVRYTEISSGIGKIESPAASRADALREISRLEAELIQTIRRVFDNTREVIK